MNENILANSQTVFESIKHIDKNGKEYWLAKELWGHFGYASFQKLETPIKKVELELVNNKQFNHVVKFEYNEDNSPKSKIDYKLSREACYKIAMIGQTQQSVNARTYFYIQTRKQELESIKLQNNPDRHGMRQQSRVSYKEYDKTLHEHGLNDYDVATTTSKGDVKLFGKRTKEIKKINNIPNNEPLEDYLPPIGIAARMLGREMTVEKTKKANLNGSDVIQEAHEKHNMDIKTILLGNNIDPEKIEMQEDIKGINTKPKPQIAPAKAPKGYEKSNLDIDELGEGFKG
jgi:DNA-damage-inducible protein D